MAQREQKDTKDKEGKYFVRQVSKELEKSQESIVTEGESVATEEYKWEDVFEPKESDPKVEEVTGMVKKLSVTSESVKGEESDTEIESDKHGPLKKIETELKKVEGTIEKFDEGVRKVSKEVESLEKVTRSGTSISTDSAIGRTSTSSESPIMEMLMKMNAKMDAHKEDMKESMNEIKQVREEISETRKDVYEINVNMARMNEDIKAIDKKVDIGIEEVKLQLQYEVSKVREELTENKKMMLERIKYNEKLLEKVSDVPTKINKIEESMTVTEANVKGIKAVCDEQYLEVKQMIGVNEKEIDVLKKETKEEFITTNQKCDVLTSRIVKDECRMDGIEERTNYCMRELETQNTHIQKFETKLIEREEEWKDDIRREVKKERVHVPMMYGIPYECGVKFNGNVKKLHPFAFIQTIRNKLKNIDDLDDMKELIKRNLVEDAFVWFITKEETITCFRDFEEQFVSYFWGETQQSIIRDQIRYGKFRPNQGKELSRYAMEIYNLAQHLRPRLTEEEIVLEISRHFKPEIRDTITIQDIKTIDQLLRYLQRIERTESWGRNENTQRRESEGYRGQGNRRYEEDRGRYENRRGNWNRERSFGNYPSQNRQNQSQGGQYRTNLLRRNTERFSGNRNVNNITRDEHATPQTSTHTNDITRTGAVRKTNTNTNYTTTPRYMNNLTTTGPTTLTNYDLPRLPVIRETENAQNF